MTLTRSQRRQTMETLISADPEVGVIKKKAPKKQSQALLTPLSSTVPLVTSSLESLSPPVETMTQRLECIHIQSSNEDNNMYCSPCNPFDDVSLPPLNKPRHEVVEMIRGSYSVAKPWEDEATVLKDEATTTATYTANTTTETTISSAEDFSSTETTSMLLSPNLLPAKKSTYFANASVTVMQVDPPPTCAGTTAIQVDPVPVINEEKQQQSEPVVSSTSSTPRIGKPVTETTTTLQVTTNNAQKEENEMPVSNACTDMIVKIDQKSFDSDAPTPSKQPRILSFILEPRAPQPKHSLTSPPIAPKALMAVFTGTTPPSARVVSTLQIIEPLAKSADKTTATTFGPDSLVFFPTPPSARAVSDAIMLPQDLPHPEGNVQDEIAKEPVTAKKTFQETIQVPEIKHDQTRVLGQKSRAPLLDESTPTRPLSISLGSPPPKMVTIDASKERSTAEKDVQAFMKSVATNPPPPPMVGMRGLQHSPIVRPRLKPRISGSLFSDRADSDDLSFFLTLDEHNDLLHEIALTHQESLNLEAMPYEDETYNFGAAQPMDYRITPPMTRAQELLTPPMIVRRASAEVGLPDDTHPVGDADVATAPAFPSMEEWQELQQPNNLDDFVLLPPTLMQRTSTRGRNKRYKVHHEEDHPQDDNITPDGTINVDRTTRVEEDLDFECLDALLAITNTNILF